MTAICAAVLLWRLPGLDPPSLYLDDQWVSIVVHDLSWREFAQLAPPVPPAFVALERLFSALSPDPEWPLQVLPILASAALVPAMCWLAWRLTGSVAAGLLAGALVASDPVLALYAVAVKQYATDALVVLVLLIVGLPLLEEWSNRRAWVLVLASLLSVPLSFASVFVSIPLAHLAPFGPIGQRRDRAGLLRSALPPLLLLDGGMALFYLGLLRRQARPSLTEYWADYFPHSLAPAELSSFLARRGFDFLALALPGPLRWGVLLCVPALVYLFMRRRSRLLGLFFLVFYAQMAAAACARLFPMGTGRADLFAHGPTLLLVAVGLQAISSWAGAGRRTTGAILCVLAAALLLGFGQRSAYRTSGDDAAVVSRLAEVVQPDDGLIVYPLSTYAVGVYGPWPIRVERWPAQGTGFEVVIDRPRTLSLHVHPGYLSEPSLMAADLREFLAHGYDRVVFVTATEARRDPQIFVHQELLDAGYEPLPAASEPPHLLVYAAPTRRLGG